MVGWFFYCKNISDEDAEATFIALVNGVSAEMVRENNDKAVWLMDAYVQVNLRKVYLW